MSAPARGALMTLAAACLTASLRQTDLLALRLADGNLLVAKRTWGQRRRGALSQCDSLFTESLFCNECGIRLRGKTGFSEEQNPHGQNAKCEEFGSKRLYSSGSCDERRRQ